MSPQETIALKICFSFKRKPLNVESIRQSFSFDRSERVLTEAGFQRCWKV